MAIFFVSSTETTETAYWVKILIDGQAQQQAQMADEMLGLELNVTTQKTHATKTRLAKLVHVQD